MNLKLILCAFGKHKRTKTSGLMCNRCGYQPVKPWELNERKEIIINYINKEFFAHAKAELDKLIKDLGYK